MIQIWCEYDYGQDHVIFQSETKALTWLQKQINKIEPDFEHNDWQVTNMRIDGLVGFKHLILVLDTDA